MNIALVLLIIIFITLIGYSLIRILGLLKEFSLLSRLSYSFGLGVGMIFLQMYTYTRLDVPWTRTYLFLPWIAVFLFTIVRYKFSLRIKRPRMIKINKLESLLIIGIAISFFYVVFEALLRPATTWDSWATWLFEAKVLFLNGGIDVNTLRHFNFYYPLVIYLLDTFVYAVLGKIDDTAILLLSSAFYFFSTILFFDVIRKRVSIRYALVFTFLLVTTQNFIRHGGRMEAGIADLPLGFYSFCCLILLLEYIKNSSYKVLFLLTAFLGFTAMIKFEGVTLSIFIGACALLHIYKKGLYKHLLFFVFWIIPVVDWQIYRKVNGLDLNYLSVHPLVFSVNKTVNAMVGTVREFINIKSWNFIWIIYFYLVVLFRKFSREQLVLNFIIFSQLSVYIITYLFTTGNDPESSIERLLMHVFFIAFFYVTITVKPLLQSAQIKKLLKPR